MPPVDGAALGVWLAHMWIPGRPRLNSGIIQCFATSCTVNLRHVMCISPTLVDKSCSDASMVLALVLYRRPDQLITPGRQLNQHWRRCVSAWSRVQNDSSRLPTLFWWVLEVLLSRLSSHSVCAASRRNLIHVFLGPMGAICQRVSAARATVLGFRLINPFVCFVCSRPFLRS